jgi:hypothetical protein
VVCPSTPRGPLRPRASGGHHARRETHPNAGEVAPHVSGGPYAGASAGQGRPHARAGHACANQRRTRLSPRREKDKKISV